MAKGRWKTEAVLQCACGATGLAQVIVGDGGFGHLTWTDDSKHILERWHQKTLVDDEPVCPACAWKDFLDSADVVELMRLQARLDEALS